MKNSKLILTVMGVMLSLSASAKIPLWWTVSPTEGDEVETLSVIKLDNGTYSDSFNAQEGATLLINGESVAYTVSYESNNGYPDDTIVITLSSPITTSGEYTINVPAGFFTYLYYGYGDAELKESDEFEWKVTVANPNETPEEPIPSETTIPEGFNITPAPDSDVDAINVLTVTAADSEITLPNALTSIIINNLPTSVTATANSDKLIITLDEEITEAGDYTIVIPKGSFRWSDITSLDNDVFVFTLHVKDDNIDTGIDDVNIEDNVTEIYTLYGVRVNEMQNGQIYIVKRAGKYFKIMGR